MARPVQSKQSKVAAEETKRRLINKLDELQKEMDDVKAQLQTLESIPDEPPVGALIRASNPDRPWDFYFRQPDGFWWSVTKTEQRPSIHNRRTWAAIALDYATVEVSSWE